MNKVYITAYSVLSSIGFGIDESLANLKTGKGRIKFPEKNDKFDKPYFPVEDNFNHNNKMTRSSQFALMLLSMIEDKWEKLSPLPIIAATSTAGIRETEQVYTKLTQTNSRYPLKKNHYFYDLYESIKDTYKDKISETYTFSTACSSAGHSILQAYRFIKNGIIDKAIVLGVDSLSITTMIGFDSLKLISHKGTKPLTKERDGLSLGEGGGILLLESDPKTEPIAEIVGVKSNSDGYHITSPNPAGIQPKECMLGAIEDAGLKPSDIDYINAHGTGTPLNDEIETNVIKSIFPSKCITTSLKGFIGHTLGSSAAIELCLILGMLKQKTIFQPSDMGTPIDGDYVPDKTVKNKDVKYFLKNSFGFGGNNVSMVIKNMM